MDEQTWTTVLEVAVAGQMVIDTERMPVPGGWLYRSHKYESRRVASPSAVAMDRWEPVRVWSGLTFVPEVNRG